jgi:hypothetical protein
VILNYVMTSLIVIMIGYSSYAMIMIRSSARPPMNQNNPSDVFSLSYYINMKQYGSAPKFYGNYYSAPVTDVKKVISGYNKVDGKYKPYYHPEYTRIIKILKHCFPECTVLILNTKVHINTGVKVVGRKYSGG